MGKGTRLAPHEAIGPAGRLNIATVEAKRGESATKLRRLRVGPVAQLIVVACAWRKQGGSVRRP